MIEQWLDNLKLVPEQEVWKTTIEGENGQSDEMNREGLYKESAKPTS